MDLVKLKDGDYLAGPLGEVFDCWLTSETPFYEGSLLSYCDKLQRNVHIENICFTVGDDHIELYDCVYVQTPWAAINPKIDSHLETFDMLAKFNVKDMKVKGKMCKRNPKKTLVTEFELELKTAEILQTVGFIVRGDSLCHNLCKYEVPTFDMSFTYRCNSEMVSLLNQETDALRRKLLETYLVENFTKELCLAIEKFEDYSLHIKLLFSDLCGASYPNRDRIRTHNRISHLAMKNLANHIINLTNDLVEEASTKLYLSRIYGLDNEKNLKQYKAYISTLHTIAFQEKSVFGSSNDTEVIISFKDDYVTIRVPVKFWEVELRFEEAEKDLKDSDGEFKHKQMYKIEEADFKLSLRKNEENQVEFKILHFKIVNFIPIASSSHPINMAMDHLVSSAIEEYMKSVMERTFTDEKLQELAIKPNVHVEDDGDNLCSDSEEEIE